jgi:hypothetical protein
MNEELAKMNKIIEEKRAIATAKEKAMVAAALEADRIASVGSDLPKDGKKNILVGIPLSGVDLHYQSAMSVLVLNHWFHTSGVKADFEFFSSALITHARNALANRATFEG